MNRKIRAWLVAAQPVVQQAIVWGMMAYWFLATSPVVWAAKKKVEAAPEPTKSYFWPYVITAMFICLGLMTICRPSSRLNKVEDGVRRKDASEE